MTSNQRRFFLNKKIQKKQEIQLSPELTHRIRNVLRLKLNDQIYLFNNSGYEFNAVISKITRNTASVCVIDKIAAMKESNLKISVFMSLIRSEKMDFAIQKAVELGASKLVPVISKRCIMKISTKKEDNRISHWRKIIVKACEQCGRTIIPSIESIKRLEEINFHEFSDKVFALHTSATESIADIELEKKDYSIIVGPEGGFEDSEINLLTKQGVSLLNLGQRILKAETAPIVALSILQNMRYNVKKNSHYI